MQDSWLAGLRHIRAAVLAVVMCAFAGCAWAQWVPERPIKLIVPFAPGAATDISARTISDRVAAILGQPIVIENQGAASGVVGRSWQAILRANGLTKARTDLIAAGSTRAATSRAASIEAWVS